MNPEDPGTLTPVVSTYQPGYFGGAMWSYVGSLVPIVGRSTYRTMSFFPGLTLHPSMKSWYVITTMHDYYITLGWKCNYGANKK